MTFDSIPLVSLLAGLQLTETIAREYDWVFVFAGGVNAGGVSIVAGCHWRLVNGNRLIVTDQDNGHWFGHGKPVDAAAVVQLELNDTSVSEVEFSQISDLVLGFTNGLALQVLVSSAGYENWNVYGPDDSHTFAIGGELRRQRS
jgi:hypothetical protein